MLYFDEENKYVIYLDDIIKEKIKSKKNKSIFFKRWWLWLSVWNNKNNKKLLDFRNSS